MRAAQNHVYRCGHLVLRVSADGRAREQLEVNAALRHVGIPVPVPAGEVTRHGSWQVTAWEWADHEAHTTASFRLLGEALGALHTRDAATLGDAWPQGPCTLTERWVDLEGNLATVRERGLADARDLEVLEDAVGRIEGWRLQWNGNDLVPCHGDVHPGNVLATDGRVVLLDWDSCGWGPRGWDHAGIIPWERRWGGAPGSYEAFASGYGGDLRDDPGTRQLVEVRLLMATVNLLASDNPAAVDAGRWRLAYWHNRDGAPTWRPW